MRTPTSERREVTVRGIVQGVGFRPFVYALARKNGLSGLVRNDADGVRIEVEDAADHERPYTGPAEHCCSLGDSPPKVAALERALAGSDGWITGVRREHGPTRAATELVEWDAKRAMWKYNPLAAWTERDLWSRIHEAELPYNPLHDRGFESIGCATCTKPGSGREGRWAGTDKTECGLHV